MAGFTHDVLMSHIQLPHSHNFFNDIYNIDKKDDDKIDWVDSVVKHNNIFLKKKRQLIVGLHGSHMSIESLDECCNARCNPIYSSYALLKREILPILKIEQKMDEREFTVHMKSVPGHSSCDLTYEGTPIMPASFLMNGAGYIDKTRDSPINQLNNDKLIKDLKEQVDIIRNNYARKWGINMLWGPGMNVPNFSMVGDHTEAAQGKLYMSSYAINWGTDDGYGLPLVYRFIELNNTMGSKSNIRLTSSFLFGDVRKYIKDHISKTPETPIHHFISACQVISRDLGKPSLDNLRNMYLSGIKSMNYFQSLYNESPDWEYNTIEKKALGEEWLSGTLTRTKKEEIENAEFFSACAEPAVQEDWLDEGNLKEKNFLAIQLFKTLEEEEKQTHPIKIIKIKEKDLNDFYMFSFNPTAIKSMPKPRSRLRSKSHSKVHTPLDVPAPHRKTRKNRAKTPQHRIRSESSSPSPQETPHCRGGKCSKITALTTAAVVAAAAATLALGMGKTKKKRNNKKRKKKKQKKKKKKKKKTKGNKKGKQGGFRKTRRRKNNKK